MTLKKMKRPATDWQKIFRKYISYKGLTHSEYIQNFYNSIMRIQTTKLKMGKISA